MLEDLFTYPETEGFWFFHRSFVDGTCGPSIGHQSRDATPTKKDDLGLLESRNLLWRWGVETLKIIFLFDFTNICHVYFFKETGDFSVPFHGRKLLPRLGAFESLYYALDLNNESCHVTLEAQCFSDCSCDGRSNDCWTDYFKRTNSHAMSLKMFQVSNGKKHFLVFHWVTSL